MEDRPESEMIQQKMDETRSSLNEKLEALEGKVAPVVEGTAEAVQTATQVVSDTVESVKETVEAVTETVKESTHAIVDMFNISKHTQRHPWAVFGSAVAVGLIGAFLIPGSPRRRRRRAKSFTSTNPERDAFMGGSSNEVNGASKEEPKPAPAKEGEGWFGGQVGKLAGLAVGSLMGAVRDVAARSLPESIGARVAEEVDSLTTSLGGEPIRGPVLPEPEQEESESMSVADKSKGPSKEEFTAGKRRGR